MVTDGDVVAQMRALTVHVSQGGSTRGGLRKRLDAVLYRGKRLILSATIRMAPQPPRASVAVGLDALRGDVVLHGPRVPVLGADGKRCAVALDVPADATAVELVFDVAGAATASLHGVELRVIGDAVPGSRPCGCTMLRAGAGRARGCMAASMVNDARV